MEITSIQNEFNSQEFKGLTLPNDSLEHKTFTSCVFVKCSFRETSFLQCEFQDCTFRNCDLSLVTLKDCTFKGALFQDSQLIGINWMDTNLAKTKYILVKPVDFVKCVLNHSTFMGLSLKNVALTRCIAKDVSFEEADLSHANCTATDFTDSRFLHTNLTEADFTGAVNYSIAPALNTLKKTKFSLPEAMSLLHGLDILLTDPQSPG
jgi:fluoroquinolone resistance protein